MNASGASVSKISVLLVLLCAWNPAMSEDLKGTVCLGRNLAKTHSEHTERLYLKIDNLPEIYFVRPYGGPRVIADSLDLRSGHTVAVFFDGQIAQSWKLDFAKLKTNSVLIWRAAGSWRMEPNSGHACE